MAIRKKEEMTCPKKIEIDLTGPDGNVFFLIGLARKLYKQLHSEEKKDANDMLDAMGAKATVSPEDLLVKEMMSSDYENAIAVFEREFGDYVDLFR